MVKEQEKDNILRFTDESMLTIFQVLENALQKQTDIIFKVLNPDPYSGLYAGTLVTVKGSPYYYRSLRSWMDLAQQLGCRMLTPLKASDTTIMLHFQKLKTDSFHQENPTDKSEKYGSHSGFSAINKNEEPAFLLAYMQALNITKLSTRKSVLNLGINRGDEFALIEELLPKEDFENIRFVGIDHAQSAIVAAQKRFSQSNLHFYSHDITKLDALDLGTFDLVISIGTLQSPGINYKPFLMELVKNHLNDKSALILGFPNSRWIDGEMVYGAKMRNYRESDMSLVLSDIDFAKRYLQQKKFTVRISGKEYLFLTATH